MASEIAATFDPELRDPRRIPFPPLIPIVALLLSWCIGRWWPLPIDLPAWSRWLGWALFTLPHGLGIWAHTSFRWHQTTVNPLGQVTQIVTGGPFAYTRNPMYLSLIPLYIGGGLAFRLPWAFVLLAPVFLLLNFGVIRPEEKYLEARFGAEYLQYKSRVPRWIGI
jgi:protein-S-isoprenylcysteine O-methyltransferase Ste14